MGVKLKILSGKEVVRILEGFGFTIHSQKGSHIKLRRDTSTEKQILIVPDRKPIPKGTLKAIFSQASRYISTAELEPYFYQ